MVLPITSLFVGMLSTLIVSLTQRLTATNHQRSRAERNVRAASQTRVCPVWGSPSSRHPDQKWPGLVVSTICWLLFGLICGGDCLAVQFCKRAHTQNFF